jgi:hypothetical protein
VQSYVSEIIIMVVVVRLLTFIRNGGPEYQSAWKPNVGIQYPLALNKSLAA